MVKIAFVVPNQPLVDVVHKAWKLNEDLFGVNPDITYSVDCELSPDIIITRHYDADVIVSRGGTASGLKERNTITPVVEIPITSSDMSASIHRAIAKYGEKPIGVVGTINTIRSVQFIHQKFAVPVKPYYTASVGTRDLIDGMERALADGCKVILAGHNTSRYCQEHNIPSALIYSSVESVFLAIIEAKRCASVSQVERDNSAIFRSVIANVYEGIITVDQNQVIRIFNPAAARLLGRKAEDCIGQQLRRVMPDGRLRTLLASDVPLANEIIRVNGRTFVFNSAPIQENGQDFGTLVSFQAEQSISNAETRLRDSRRSGSYIAKYSFQDVLGESEEMRSTIQQARRFAHVDSNVLLVGETGTGKELFAQSIHNESERAAGPFVAVNCASIPESLMESELFGYESGAFTGASKQGKAGLFEAAHDGTIFLDEISEVPMTLQSRLLRVLQEREVRRVGATSVVSVNVRVLCATNRDLKEMIRKGTFRADLYYRLNVLTVRIPPLRERGNDVAFIMQHYLTHYANRFGRGMIRLTPEAERQLACYAWPGNVREVRNISEQLVVLCEGNQITAEDILVAISDTSEKPSALPVPAANVTLDELERQQIEEVLARGVSRKEAAQMLGISKTTLWRRCKELGIE